MSQIQRQAGGKVKILSIVLTLVITILFFESFSFLVLSLRKGEMYSKDKMNVEQINIIESSGHSSVLLGQPRWMRRDIIHPYIGYVLDHPTEADEYGFLNNISPIQKKNKDQIILAITGGSFAYETYDKAIDSLVRLLKKDRLFKDKEIITLRLAAGGYKQPQQLMIFNYLISLGAEFDLLVNIDGFNEAALPLAENIPMGVFPFYPRKWFSRIEALSDPILFQQISAGMHARNLRVKFAKALSSSLFANSFTAIVIWDSVDSILQARISRLNQEIYEKRRSASSYAASGPRVNFNDDKGMFKEIADVWKRSSLCMKSLADSNNIQYFHFLQPNQYLQGSKVLNDEEMRNAYKKEHMYKEPVENVYPYLISSGRELIANDVSFKDLTMIFVNHNDTLYRDACCHLNERGYQIVALAISDFILAQYSE